MESKYDRVAYPENVYLHSDGEQDDFGTGVYPVSVISRSRFRDDYIKIACIKVKRKFQTLLIVGAILFVMLIVTLGITIHAAVARQSKQTQVPQEDPCKKYTHKGNNPNNKDYGE